MAEVANKRCSMCLSPRGGIQPQTKEHPAVVVHTSQATMDLMTRTEEATTREIANRPIMYVALRALSNNSIGKTREAMALWPEEDMDLTE